MGIGQQDPGMSVLSIEVHGDLRLHGDAGATEITASDGAKIRQSGNNYVLESRDDCEVTIPAGMTVSKLRVHGDAVVRNLSGSMHVTRIDGDLNIGDAADVTIGEVMGDLQVEGRVTQISGNKVHGDLTVRVGDGAIALGSIDGDASVEGRMTAVRFGNVGGDVSLRAVDGPVSLDNVGGDLAVRGAVPSIQCNNAGGDVSLRGSFGTVEMRAVGGDFAIDDAQSLLAHSVGGDLSINGSVQRLDCHNVGGDLSANGVPMLGGFRLNVGGDASFAVAPQAGEEYDISAGGDVACALSADANADIIIRNWEGVQELRAGNGGAKMRFNAGGDVSLSGAESVDMRRHVKQGGRKMGAFKIKLPSFRMNIPIPPIPPIPPMPKIPSFSINFGDDDAPAAPSKKPAAPVSQSIVSQPAQTLRYDPKPVATEEERVVILRMLAEKKITVAQAEQLLAALEGGA